MPDQKISELEEKIVADFILNLVTDFENAVKDSNDAMKEFIDSVCRTIEHSDITDRIFEILQSMLYISSRDRKIGVQCFGCDDNKEIELKNLCRRVAIEEFMEKVNKETD